MSKKTRPFIENIGPETISTLMAAGDTSMDMEILTIEFFEDGHWVLQRHTRLIKEPLWASRVIDEILDESDSDLDGQPVYDGDWAMDMICARVGHWKEDGFDLIERVTVRDGDVMYIGLRGKAGRLTAWSKDTSESWYSTQENHA